MLEKVLKVAILILIIPIIVLWDSFLLCKMWDWFVKPHVEFSLKFSIPVFTILAISLICMKGKSETSPEEAVSNTLHAQFNILILYAISYVIHMVIM